MFSLLFATTGDSGADKDSGKGFFNFEIGTLWKHGKLTTVSTLYLGAFSMYILFVAALMILRVESTTWVKPEDVSFAFRIIIFSLPIVLGFEGFMLIANRKSNDTQSVKATKPKKR